MAELILEILEDLKKEHFEKFTFYLNGTVLEGCRPIPQGQLEDKTRTGVVTLMKRSYGDKIVNITRAILKKIQRNDLVERLEDGLEKSVEARGWQTNEQQRELTLRSGAAGSDVSPGRKSRIIEDSPLSSSHQDCGTEKEKLAQMIQEKLKSSLKAMFERIFEGFAHSEKCNLLNSIYTKLYITEGDCEGVNTEHEVWQIETAFRTQSTQTTAIRCNKIFKPLPGQEISIRTVLTKGIAGIGKTVSVQKFVLDWAAGEANQDIDFMFVLSFRELNLFSDEQYSLLGLLQEFHPETKGIENIELDLYRVLFIFDGLDESRLPLNFRRNKILSDVTKVSSVDVLLTNLIKGKLLPSALVWITSRPAAANQIPPGYFHRFTEVHGFSDPQKKKYFKKRFSDKDLARRIISHVKTSRSLYIMCHIPVFCWISATVLEKMLGRADIGEIPKTLTGMYTRFLLIQSNIKNEKYDDRHETETQKLLVSDKEIILKLGQLAFQQLEKDNLVFYEEDLRDCGIDVTEASHSGVCTEIFKQESVLCKKKVYSFVHLSLQEYLAALHVVYSITVKNFNALNVFFGNKDLASELSLCDLHKLAIQKALVSKNGHLDLFLRFLLGLSLDSNQSLLKGLLKRTGSTSESIKETIKYIKGIEMDDPSPERFINLFHCLSELNDDSFQEEVQEYLSSNELDVPITAEHCSALAYMLLMSEKVLDEFDLIKYNASDEGRRRLVPAVKCCRKAVLHGCNLTTLDLSTNNLGDSGVELLCAALSGLHILRLRECNLTEGCCDALASVLRSHQSELRELELRDNDLQDSGVRALSAGLEDPQCKLQRLGLSGCGVTQTGCASLASALRSNPSHLRELDLSYNHPGDSGGLEDPSCKLETLLVDHGGEIRIKPGLRKYACQLTLDPNTVHEVLYLSEGDRKTQTLGPHRQVSVMAELILEILEDLKKEHFEKFTFYLNGTVLEGCRPIPQGQLEDKTRTGVVTLMKRSYGDKIVNITQEILKKIQRNDLVERLEDGLEKSVEARGWQTNERQQLKEKLRSRMARKSECIFEGVAKAGKRTLLSRIYTKVYITEGVCEGVNNEHEVWQIETAFRTQSKQSTQDRAVNCNDIFNPLPGQDITIRTVLTTGIAGIGKTVSVQKFVLDWAAGEANQDVDFMFVLTFRELNLINDEQYSLLELLQLFYPEPKGIENIEFDIYRVVFIFDGLDESKLPLNFRRNKILSDVTKVSSVDVLLTNLIEGNLLPSALLWITSRPAAANQIPPKYFHRLTEVHGFSDPQKEEYFRKKFSNQDLADRIVSHVKTSRSLYIMCYIPVFCWISATVLEQMLGRAHTGEIPKTLTGMYTHFLLFQTNIKNEKFDDRHETEMQKLLESDKEILLKLGQLAFQQLEKDNPVFYEEDLRECGINVTEASVYSGVCTEIFKQESVLYQKKVYSFVHLSFQEYLAALHVLDSFTHNKLNALGSFFPSVPSELSLHDLHKKAIEKALESKNGHLDLFIRFLLGLSLDSNQSLLQGLLKPTGSTSRSIRKTVKYIKKRSNKDNLSPDRCINLLHCLSELNDDSLEKEVKQYLTSGDWISPAHCSALAYMLLMSEKALDEFDLRKYNTLYSGSRRLVPVVKHCRKAVLSGFDLSVESCEITLDLSTNNLGDSGVKLLCATLSTLSGLHILRLGWCNLTEGCCNALASVLHSHHSELRELELRDNDLQDSGVRALSAGLEDPHCKLQRLGLSGCRVTQRGCASLASALRSNPSHLRELDLSYNHPGDSGVRALSAGLEDPSCKLETLLVDHGGVIRLKPGLRKYACQLTLDPNTPCGELSLSEGGRKENLEKLSVYFSKTEWTRLQKCEKVRYKNIKRNHLAMLAIGLTSTTPAFMKRGRARRAMLVRTCPAEDSDSEDEEWRPSMERRPRVSRNFNPRFRRASENQPPSGASENSAAGQGRSETVSLPETQAQPPASSALGSTQRVKNAGVGGVEEGKAFLDSASEKQRGGSKPANRGLLKKELNTYTRGDNLRSRPSVRYTEEEEPRDEDYLYCEECDSFFTDECEVHGPPSFISDSPAPLGAPSRAQLTLPLSLEVRVSGIPGAGLGVFNRDQRLPVGVHFGPYEGELTDEDEAIDSGYSWMIYRSKRCVDYIDARRETHSNWMRYVNCARNEEEQNLVAFQYRGSILYCCFKPILPGHELLVWYGEEYAKHLGITFDYLWSNKCSAKGGERVSSEFFSCTQCPLSYTAEVYLHKHIKRSHPDEYPSFLKGSG
ncbi:hypothetical protein AAFF_G00348570 [Aldrovandia affinis]|uniref:Uncharacterized protein n=1 Tax=Aldrovandia affinis TaxID=143900 RepID=A0AAD7R5U4_9TELE|nr:hypothetical protein AAFF_G00348570 [Aldrovandia affinis]